MVQAGWKVKGGREEEGEWKKEDLLSQPPWIVCTVYVLYNVHVAR